MKILLMNQFFWPDTSATSQLLTDVARSLADDGHEVTAISSGAGGYGLREAPAGAPAVTNLRVRALPFGRGTLGRLLSYLSFYITAAWRGLTLPRQDVVLTLTTPPLLSLLGTLLKHFRGTRHVIWEMDVYPEVATDLGYFRRGGPADLAVGWLADVARNGADRVIALGDCMKTRLLARGLADERVSVIHNWADARAILPVPRGESGELVLLYSGNLGLAHDLSTITGAMTDLRHDARFRFLFVGSGGRRAELAAAVQANGLTHVELRPYVERASLSESLAVGDIGLVTQRVECCGSVVPSKVYGLLAAGRPILFIGPREATPAQIIRQFGCGWHIEVAAREQLVRLLEHLAEHRDEIRFAGERARLALVDHFDLPLGTARIQAVLEEVVSAGSTLRRGAAVTSGAAAVRPSSASTLGPEVGASSAPQSFAEQSTYRGDHQTCTL